FSVPHAKADSFVDWAALKALPVLSRGRYCVHVRTELGMDVVMDGLKGHGLIKKPGRQLTPAPNSDNIYCD
ncbi:MAG: hypothetical protein KKI09_11765, partial [Spirochaetes bacterium]|nr:hypothetical protein [Spirochaetota bacterium]